MNLGELRKEYGDEYPVAVMLNGIRLPLQRESRFVRCYQSEEPRLGAAISRFMDGSAGITAAQLQQQWPTWSEIDRLDFCQSCRWLRERGDFADMLRFIMQHGGPRDWSGIALSVGLHLAKEEAFALLCPALRATEMGRTSNILQGIAHTKHPNAGRTLREHIELLWAHPLLWDDDTFLNGMAFDATTCIAYLIETGAKASEFEEQVRRHSQHICAGNRRSCRTFLAKEYPWLN